MNSQHTLWMGNIDPWMNSIFIKDSFIKSGFRPKSVKLIVDKRTNKFHNFCLVNFNSLEEANNALFNLNGKLVPNSNIYYKLNLIKNNKPNNKNVYVGHLSPTVNDNELYNYFKSRYPSVYYASVINEKGLSKGYGFVHFSKEEEYINCLKEMDGTIFHNQIIRVRERRNTEKQTKRKNKYSQVKILYNNTQIPKYNDIYPQIEIYNININNFIFNQNSNINNKEENYSSENVETAFFSQEREKEKEREQEKISSLSNVNSNNLKKKVFLDNIELLKSNDYNALYKKIKESINQMIVSYKSSQNNEEISPMILYYSSIDK